MKTTYCISPFGIEDGKPWHLSKETESDLVSIGDFETVQDALDQVPQGIECQCYIVPKKINH